MGNIDTVWAVTENILEALKATGIHFGRKTYDDEKNIPASLIPYGEVYYTGERFEATHGQRPSYAEAGFTVRVVLNERDPVDMVRMEQAWVHRVRSSLTVGALNAGGLSGSVPVSRVSVEDVRVDNRDYISRLEYRVVVRYREI